MASLYNIRTFLETLKGPPRDEHRPSHWTKRELEEHLRRCPTPPKIYEWHLVNVSWIHAHGNPALKILCNTVASCLVSASKEALLLRKFASGIIILPTNISTDAQTTVRIHTDRHLIIRALEEILSAFEAFAVVNKDSSLRQSYIKAMILEYLRKSWKMMLVLGLLCWDHQTDSLWFQNYQSFLYQTQLRDFKFDSESDYERKINDPTVTGVINDQSQVPATCLPLHPTPPYLIRDSGTYARTIQINGLYQHPGMSLLLRNCVFRGSFLGFYFGIAFLSMTQMCVTCANNRRIEPIESRVNSSFTHGLTLRITSIQSLPLLLFQSTIDIPNTSSTYLRPNSSNRSRSFLGMTCTSTTPYADYPQIRPIAQTIRHSDTQTTKGPDRVLSQPNQTSMDKSSNIEAQRREDQY
jgi:hypothetical protein